MSIFAATEAQFSDGGAQVDRVDQLLLASADLMKRSAASCTGLSAGARKGWLGQTRPPLYDAPLNAC